MKKYIAIVAVLLVAAVICGGLSIFSTKPEIITHSGLEAFAEKNTELIYGISQSLLDICNQNEVATVSFELKDSEFEKTESSEYSENSYEKTDKVKLSDDMNEKILACLKELDAYANAKYDKDEYTVSISVYNSDIDGASVGFEIYDINYRVSYGVCYSEKDLAEEGYNYITDNLFSSVWGNV